jgi:hypothetical protein
MGSLIEGKKEHQIAGWTVYAQARIAGRLDIGDAKGNGGRLSKGRTEAMYSLT